MARILICDRCKTKDGQQDFDHYTIYREDATNRTKDSFTLDLCPQCSVEFREFYREAWTGLGPQAVSNA